MTASAPETAGHLIERVRTELKALGRSERWLSGTLNRAHTTMWRKLKGDGYDLTIGDVLGLAEALKLSPAELVPELFAGHCACCPRSPETH